jgi:hypothetical protein
MDKKPVYCMHCSGWYVASRADQCDPLPRENVSSGNISIVGVDTFEIKQKYGKPSVLNKDNNCPNYRDVGVWGRISRKLFLGIPLRPQKVSKLEE